MELAESRRLPGVNAILDGWGAVIDVRLEPHEVEPLVAAWRAEVLALLAAVGWHTSTPRVRAFGNGISLAFDAPNDALLAATEVNECAYARAVARLEGREPGELAEQLRPLLRAIAKERNPRLIELERAARAHGVVFFNDPKLATVGGGAHARTFALDALPAADTIDWSAVRDVPMAMVTGTNGKSTTVRLLAAIAKAAGECPGISSTDWVRVGDEQLDAGDYSGPGGARLVLRDPRTTIAILETARGGILRRGLAVERVDVAAVLNVAADHLGEWGVGSMTGLADAKFVVAKVAKRLVLGADDPLVVERGQQLERAGRHEIVWFSLAPEQPMLLAHLERGGRAALLVRDELVLARGGDAVTICTARDIPITLGGAARHNIANALAAAAVAHELGLPIDAIRRGLAAFGTQPGENPGRLEQFTVNGARVLVDFAHNPHGFDAILDTARALGGARLAIMIGQAGDRDDDAILGLARSTWAAQPDMVFVKEMSEYLRGRELRAIPTMIIDELHRCGAPAHRVRFVGEELDTIAAALDWVQPEDVLVLPVHAQREKALALVRERAI